MLTYFVFPSVWSNMLTYFVFLSVIKHVDFFCHPFWYTSDDIFRFSPVRQNMLIILSSIYTYVMLQVNIFCLPPMRSKCWHILPSFSVIERIDCFVLSHDVCDQTGRKHVDHFLSTISVIKYVDIFDYHQCDQIMLTFFVCHQCDQICWHFCLPSTWPNMLTFLSIINVTKHVDILGNDQCYKSGCEFLSFSN